MSLDNSPCTEKVSDLLIWPKGDIIFHCSTFLCAENICWFDPSGCPIMREVYQSSKSTFRLAILIHTYDLELFLSVPSYYINPMPTWMTITHGYTSIRAILKQLNMENAQQMIEQWHKVTCKHQAVYNIQNRTNIKVKIYE